VITTLQQHILHHETPGATGNCSSLLSGITLATKMIEARLRRAGLSNALGSIGTTNIHGEAQQKLDVYANQTLLHCLGARENVFALISEENEEPFILDRSSNSGKYVIVFDPLDGSSNIDANVNIGTIFSIFRRIDGAQDGERQSILQPGRAQIAAGYVLYGPSTVLVYTFGQGVCGFTLDPAIGAYVMSHENMRMPRQGKHYSCNEATVSSFPREYQEYLRKLRNGEIGRAYDSRYIGSLVADFHRTLLHGGVFLYPPTRSHPSGKLRLLYEANPLAFIAEQAGGLAVDGELPILSICPSEIHQRVPLVIGGQSEIQAFLECAVRQGD
jgi:fructose-1,6-bisphosphatase I